jgi:hypothetical protein
VCACVCGRRTHSAWVPEWVSEWVGSSRACVRVRAMGRGPLWYVPACLPVCVGVCLRGGRRPRALANALFAERGKQGKAETSTWVRGWSGPRLRRGARHVLYLRAGA